MGPFALSLLLASFAASPDVQQAGPGETFQTTKALDAIQACLTDKLSERGEVTAVKADGMTTLMLRQSQSELMLIDLAPPSVAVTTKFLFGTRKVVEACL